MFRKPKTTSTERLKACQYAIGFFILFFVFQTSAFADSFEDRRAQVGMKLFRTLVTADLKLNEKTDANNSISVLLVYANNLSKAKQYLNQLQLIFKSSNNYSFQVVVGNLDALKKESQNQQYAAIFIAQLLKDEELKPVVDYGIKSSIVVFSPFEGDVERGVLGGLSVQATVKPAINMQTLVKSKLSIKPFFMKVAKRYE